MARWLDNALGAFADSAFDTYNQLQAEARRKAQEERDAAAEKRAQQTFDDNQTDRANIQRVAQTLYDQTSTSPRDVANTPSRDVANTPSQDVAKTVATVNNVNKGVDGAPSYSLDIGPTGDIEMKPGLPAPSGQLIADPSAAPIMSTPAIQVTPDAMRLPEEILQGFREVVGRAPTGGGGIALASMEPSPVAGAGLPPAPAMDAPSAPIDVGSQGVPSEGANSAAIALASDPVAGPEVAQDILQASQGVPLDGTPSQRLVAASRELLKVAATSEQLASAFNMYLGAQDKAVDESITVLGMYAQTDPSRYLQELKGLGYGDITTQPTDDGRITIMSDGKPVQSYDNFAHFHQIVVAPAIAGDRAGATAAWTQNTNRNDQQEQLRRAHELAVRQQQLAEETAGFTPEFVAGRKEVADLFNNGRPGDAVARIESLSAAYPTSVWRETVVPVYENGYRIGSDVQYANIWEPVIKSYVDLDNGMVAQMSQNLANAMVEGDDELTTAFHQEIDKHYSVGRSTPQTGAWKLVVNHPDFRAMYYQKMSQKRDEDPPPADGGGEGSTTTLTGVDTSDADAPDTSGMSPVQRRRYQRENPSKITLGLDPAPLFPAGVDRPRQWGRMSVPAKVKWLTDRGYEVTYPDQSQSSSNSRRQRGAPTAPAQGVTPTDAAGRASMQPGQAPVPGALQPPPGFQPSPFTDSMEQRTTERGLPAPIQMPEFQPMPMPTPQQQPNPGFNMNPRSIQRPVPVDTRGAETARRGLYTDDVDLSYRPQRGMPARPMLSNDPVYQPVMQSQPRPAFPMQPLQNMSVVQGVPAPNVQAPPRLLETLEPYQQLLTLQRSGAPRSERVQLENELLQQLSDMGLTVRDAFNMRVGR